MIIFIKTPTGTKFCPVIEIIENEKQNKATINVKGIVPSNNVTTNIDIEDLKAFNDHQEVISKHGYFKILKPVHHHGNTQEQSPGSAAAE